MSGRQSEVCRRRWVLAACVTAWVTAFVLTHVPAPHLPQHVGIGDKSLHTAGYAGLASLLWFSLRLYGRSPLRRVPLVVCLLFTYATLDELTQPFFRRSADVVDWIHDCLGVVTAVIVWEVAALLTRRRAAVAR